MTNPMGQPTSRRNMLKLAGSFGAAAALAGTLAACTPAEGPATTSPTTPGGAETTAGTETSAAGAQDGKITAAISYELGTNGYDPMTTTSALTLAANWHTLEGLTDIHPATREVYAALGADLPQQIDETTWRSPCATVPSSTTAHPSPPMTSCSPSSAS